MKGAARAFEQLSSSGGTVYKRRRVQDAGERSLFRLVREKVENLLSGDSAPGCIRDASIIAFYSSLSLRCPGAAGRRSVRAPLSRGVNRAFTSARELERLYARRCRGLMHPLVGGEIASTSPILCSCLRARLSSVVFLFAFLFFPFFLPRRRTFGLMSGFAICVPFGQTTVV